MKKKRTPIPTRGTNNYPKTPSIAFLPVHILLFNLQLFHS